MKPSPIAFVVLLINLFFTTNLFAGVDLIISDVDDTLKVTHARNKSDAIKNVSIIENHFLLMPELYNLLTQNQNNVISYVSKSPGFLSSKINKLLEYGNFPSGELFTRNNVFDSKYKIKTISKIIKATKPNKVILFGDNGQDDSADYLTLTRKFKDIEFITYIRIAYPTQNQSLPSSQIGFVTSLEVLIDLQDKQIIPKDNFILEQAAQVINNNLYLNFTPTNKPTLFPNWYNCQGFKWIWKKVFPSTEVTTAVNNILAQCSTF